MQLYVTLGSPYARMARIVVIEKRLESRVEVIVAATRQADSPYYDINPSGRVPYLVRDDGVGMEGSAIICAYLDQLDAEPILHGVAGSDCWEARRLEASARSLLDGLAVWTREVRRPPSEQSPAVIAHEAARAMRMVGFWAPFAERPVLAGPLNVVQIIIACGLALETRLPAFRWRDEHTRLAQWYDRICARPSLAATAPVAVA